MSKRCSKCLRILDESAFNWKYKNIKLQYHCKECSRKYVREHYKNNTRYYIDKAHRRNIEVKEKSLKYIGNNFKTHPCVDCGETDILVLEFDHRLRSDKFREISRLIKSRGTFKKVVDEITKCEVRCANCHRRKTAIESNSWRLQYGSNAPVAQRIE